jgi:hypothetical protein
MIEKINHEEFYEEIVQLILANSPSSPIEKLTEVLTVIFHKYDKKFNEIIGCINKQEEVKKPKEKCDKYCFDCESYKKENIVFPCIKGLSSSKMKAVTNDSEQKTAKVKH